MGDLEIVARADCASSAADDRNLMSDADKPALRPANENPWYCLATLYGEQPVDGFDYKLASKNRMAWNRWMASALSDEKRAELVKGGFPELELAPFSPEEKSAFCSAFTVRKGSESELPPEPTERHVTERQVYDFTSTHFDRAVTFAGFLFAPNADFSLATFSDRANFQSATFSVANFESATFSGPTDFASATFSLANFESATFSGPTDFASTTFFYADFKSATFSGRTIFISATFNSVAVFDLATFSFNAVFARAEFKDHAEFISATFAGPIIFSSTKFSDDANFTSARFSHIINFRDAKFDARTTFARSDFGDQVPDFRGATMHEATEWHGSIWPKPPHDIKNAQAQVYAYERLKQEMERLKKHEDEQRFFRRELRARRGLARPGSGEWVLNLLYQASSNYGQSVALPLIWLFGLFATGSAVFYLIHATNPGSAALTIPHAAATSFGNIFPFVPITHELMNANPVTAWSRTEKIIGVAQTLLGTPLLFLLGLALRNRFRMK
jgi:uncharacterized protein YjbI with pentapeptide repeats